MILIILKGNSKQNMQKIKFQQIIQINQKKKLKSMRKKIIKIKRREIKIMIKKVKIKGVKKR